MKALFGVILTALFLIAQPALAWQKYDIAFSNAANSGPTYLSKINDKCMDSAGPLNFSVNNKYKMTVEDMNSGVGICLGIQKKIIWAVSHTHNPASLDPKACLVQFSVTYYWFDHWHAAITSTCENLISYATCRLENCLNYCPDLNNCHMTKTGSVGVNVPDSINIVFAK
ncbi:hypothetical protein [Xenorhabdus szentirmaii]|uniref:Uncharacterized protein n=1 Tax=Xenorhabdus szentirmaii DSM 16338 TaxID=1427518 RepID=W1IZQ0_9GAMM|nr:MULTISPECIES: hypothetical protein [Xenorhabdus]MBD2781464.1 hypothetical protein [Xenorhabdus sp. 38]MBD2793548.1 hypothetical protein [Xenorhabdus sp. CUL]MBD2806135.1 hypothetical protein [Xenorhabdus sp. ZM]MBD2822175.1 hypothetical protein [Xenorhabdus sp. 42]MBD2825493.1 hypothetical protein [Xenorhabdus sp. 5]